MSVSLPPEVLLLICGELGNRQDFGTLFNCALAGTEFTEHALSWLYRIHSQASVVTGEGNDADFAGSRGLTIQARSEEQKRVVAKWALQWKSIIRSSLGNTRYKYCLYIRSLDLRNLYDLLADPLFRDAALDNFFADDMAKFLKAPETPVKNKLRGAKGKFYSRINIPMVLDLVGESITSYISDSASKQRKTFSLEDLAGQINSEALETWTSRLSQLKSLTLWDGASLNEKVATSIAQNCYGFDDLAFFSCLPTSRLSYADIDQNLASFFRALRTNSLRSFSALSAKAVGPETLLALNNHAQSLKVLKLSGLDSASIRKISLLQECKAIEALEIADADGHVDLEATENDVFLDTIAWLGNCPKLQELHISNLVSAPAILTKVCMNNDTRLRELEVNGYNVHGNRAFHTAISQQTSLELLKLMAEPEETDRDDIDTLVSTVCQLTKLKYLNLVVTSDFFRTPDIILIAGNLTSLEELWFNGDVDDFIWPTLSTLTNLRSLNIHAVSSFSFEGILAFISSLQESNEGLLLSVMSQKLEYDLSEQEQSIIRDSIRQKVDGQFDYVLYRDAESESDSLSD